MDIKQAADIIRAAGNTPVFVIGDVDDPKFQARIAELREVHPGLGVVPDEAALATAIAEAAKRLQVDT